MIVAASLKRLFDELKIAYQLVTHKRVAKLDQAARLLNIDPGQVITAQVLEDELGKLLVVYRLDTKIDLIKLQALLTRTFTVESTTEVNRLFFDCEAGCWPPIGQAYGLEVLLDASIIKTNKLYFSSGSHTALIQISTDDFLYLNMRAKVLDFAQPHTDSQANIEHISSETANFLQNLTLPNLPPIAAQILQVSMNNNYSVPELAELVSKDPLIQQQITLYTKAPLNFEKLSHIALGVAASRAFDSGDQTAHDTIEFWRHAFYAAAYAERITQLVAPEHGLQPALSYLAGLFHNFGLLLFSQLFRPEYDLLKKWVKLNPKVSIAVLEKRLLGMGSALNVVTAGHSQLGERLLRHWQMPEAICVVAREHHCLSYNGPYTGYVSIIQLTNQLLREDGIGDGTLGGIPAELLDSLGLTAAQIIESITAIKAGSDNLEQMARHLTTT